MFFRPPEDDGVADLDFWATEDVRGGGDEDDISVMGLREGEKEERVGEKIVFAMRRLAEMLSLSLDSPRLFGRDLHLDHMLRDFNVDDRWICRFSCIDQFVRMRVVLSPCMARDMRSSLRDNDLSLFVSLASLPTKSLEC